MRYYLWDTDVAKLLGAYQTEDKALTLVRALVARYGHEFADDLALGVEFNDRSPGEALSGADLLARTEVVPSNHAASESRASERTTAGDRPLDSG